MPIAGKDENKKYYLGEIVVGANDAVKRTVKDGLCLRKKRTPFA